MRLRNRLYIAGKSKRKRKLFLRFLALYAAAALCAAGCGKDFDAAGYAEALLSLTFQGEITQAAAYTEDASKETLMKAYQDSIDRFVAANITSGLNVGELKSARFGELVSKIFMTMRYSVGEADKTGRKEYEVAVDIWPADVFVNFKQLLTADSLKMAEKIEAGEYEGGTEEETNQKILNDIVNHAYELLDTAYMDIRFGDKETVTLRVYAEKGEDYSIDEEDMDALIRRILRLDE